jgi:putative ABC transport system substrate-binding protein
MLMKTTFLRFQRKWRLAGGVRKRVCAAAAVCALIGTGAIAQAPEALLFERAPGQRVLVVLGGDYAEFRATVDGVQDKLVSALPRVQVEIVTFPSAAPPKYWVRAQLKQPPAVIVAIGTRAATLFQREAPDTPLVYTMVYNPQLSGLLPATETADAKIAGVMLNVPVEKRLEHVRAVLPNAKRIGIIYNPNETGPVVAQVRAAAAPMEFSVVTRAVASEKEVRDAAESLWWQMDALWLTADPTVLTPQTFHYLVQESLQRRVPIVGLSPSQVRAGALMSVSASDYRDLGEQTAELALHFLGKQDGKTPILVQSPRKIGLYLNLRAAKMMGIPIPSETAAKAVARYE